VKQAAFSLLLPLVLWTLPVRAAAPPRIDNPNRPAGGLRTATLQQQWRVGDQDDVLLGRITGAARDSAGRVYLLDNQLATIHVFAPDGTFLRDVGREGDGPGELSHPTQLVLFPDGRLGVSSSSPARLTLLRTDGTPAGDITLVKTAEGGFSSLVGVLLRGGVLIAQCSSMQLGDGGLWHQQVTLARYDHGGVRHTVFDSLSLHVNLSRPRYVERDEFFPPWTVGPAGGVFLAPERDAYRVVRYDTTGAITRVITRAYTPRRRSKEEKGRVGMSFVVIVDGKKQHVERVVEENDPAIARLYVTRNGDLWVLSSRGQRDRRQGVAETWDVFSPSGRYREQVALACPFDFDHDRIIRLDDDHWLLLHNSRSPDGEAPDADDETDAEPLEAVLYTLAR